MNKPTKRRSLIFVVTTIALASSVSMLGGLALESVVEEILPLIPLILALPALNTMVGDYATIIASYEELNISDRLELKLISAVSKSIVVNILSVVILSLAIAYFRDYALDAGFITKYIIFIAGATILTVVAIFVIAKALNYMLMKHKANVEDVLIPIVTSVTDVLMLCVISLSVVLVF